MATKDVDNWDEPLPSISSEEDEEEEEEQESEPTDLQRMRENIDKLQCYVNRMAYNPRTPVKASPRTEALAKAKARTIISNVADFSYVADPKVRTKRWQRMTAKYTAITTEQLEQIIKAQREKEKKKENLLKRKQELYYEMLTKLERQCRTQYLNVLMRKFANFIAKLATTMHIPPQLVEPYARMQRGLFCNILLAIDVQPASQAALYYNSQEALEYEVCHKLAHALLSLIIKALDTASTKNPEDLPTPEADLEMDNYIKDRLMCAAEKKLHNARKCPKTKPLNLLEGLCNHCET